MPPADLTLLEMLKQAGADTVGIHIESFDSAVLEDIAPFKAELGLPTYLSVWKEAVRVFGKNQVSSFIIAGLGEEFKSVLDGASLLCEIGVYPFIVPLRPIPGTRFDDHTPPHPDSIIALYRSVADLLLHSGLSWRQSKAGCVRCGACSGLPDFEYI
jgi:radical SAM protein (TIGR04043 family)